MPTINTAAFYWSFAVNIVAEDFYIRIYLVKFLNKTFGSFFKVPCAFSTTFTTEKIVRDSQPLITTLYALA